MVSAFLVEVHVGLYGHSLDAMDGYVAANVVAMIYDLKRIS